MDPFSNVFYRNFTPINCNPLYPNPLEWQIGSWITYGRQLELIQKPNEIPNHRVNVNWSSTAPMEGLFNDDDIEITKTVQSLRRSRKTITRREVFLGEGAQMNMRP